MNGARSLPGARAGVRNRERTRRSSRRILIDSSLDLGFSVFLTAAVLTHVAGEIPPSLSYLLAAPTEEHP